MSDQTPRVPGFWYSREYGLFSQPYGYGNYWGITGKGCIVKELPADAVKLVPEPNAFDEAVERQEIWDNGRQHGYNRAHHEIQEAERERDALRAAIRAVLARYEGADAVDFLDEIEAILDKETR